LCTRGGILHYQRVLALRAAVAEFSERGAAIRQQACFVRRIDPGPRHHARAIARADLVLIDINDRVKCRGIDEPFFDEQGFQ
jgi:hypothetical protein